MLGGVLPEKKELALALGPSSQPWIIGNSQGQQMDVLTSLPCHDIVGAKDRFLISGVQPWPEEVSSLGLSSSKWSETGQTTSALRVAFGTMSDQKLVALDD